MAAAPVLPIELRCAIDTVVLRVSGQEGVIHGQVVGNATLVDELGRYARVEQDGRLLIALCADQTEVKNAVERYSPVDVVSLSAGVISKTLRLLRPEQYPLPDDLPKTSWRALGYRPVGAVGLRGVGSLAWAVLERLARRSARPDVADRCRIGMLRTIPAHRLASPLAVVVVRIYTKASL